MSEIDQIKKNIDIFSMAQQFGANPNASGKCKHNCLRAEKTCSLQLYKETNTYSDFGDTSGSVIDFYMKAKGIDLATAIKELKEMGNVVPNQDYELVTIAPMPKKEYMASTIVRKIFDRQIPLDYKEHKSLLTDILPYWVYHQAEREDTEQFQNIMRKSEQEDTLIILLKDEHSVEKTMRYRYKMVGEEMKKWVAIAGSESNFLYTRLTENPITIVTEGTSCYLTALLLGYSVISLPSSSYKGEISPELTKGRTLVFIGDDDESGIKIIDRLVDETICNKKRFNYKDFKTKGTDFKSMVEQHKSIESFKKKFDKYISELELMGVDSWSDILAKANKSVTRQIIDEVENAKFLVDGLLPYNNITTLVGVPNVGKSAVSFAVANMLLEDDVISDLIYFDADNPLIYVKSRIIKLFDKFDENRIKYYTGSTASKKDMISTLETLALLKGGGEKVLIVIDSLKNFINGSINDDKVTNELFDLLQRVRDNFKATIIVLHHTRKGKDEDGKLNYVGSQVILASSDNMTYISRDDVTKDLLFDNDKARALIPPKITFDLDFENMVLSGARIINEDEEKEEVDAVKIVIDELKKAVDGVEIKELKKRLRDAVTAKEVGEIIKDKKLFRWNKNGDNGWMVLLNNFESKEPVITEFVSELEMEFIEPELNVNELESLGL